MLDVGCFGAFFGLHCLQILASVRTANADVVDVSPQHDCSELEVTVVSPFFDGLANFKRRDMVHKSLDGLWKELGFHPQIVKLNMYSPAEHATEGGDKE